MIESEVIDTRCGEPHVTAEQIMDVNTGTYGDADYVLPTGKQITAELVTNNSVRIFDGVMVYGGIRDAIPVNKYYDIPIDNGAQGKNRNDIIVRRFIRGEGTSGTGAASFTVVKGTPAEGVAVDPEITETDLRGGALTHDMVLHRVRLEGLNIVAVEPLYKVLYNMDELQRMFAELNSKILKYHIYSPGPITVPANTMVRQMVVSGSDMEGLLVRYNATAFVGFCTLCGGYADQMQVTFAQYGKNANSDLYCQIDNRHSGSLTANTSVCILMV